MCASLLRIAWNILSCMGKQYLFENQDVPEKFIRGGYTGCLRNTNLRSSLPKEVLSTYELTARNVLLCAVSHRLFPPRQTSHSRNMPASLVPICNRTFAAVFTPTSGSRGFGVAPSTTASVQDKKFPSLPSADWTGGVPLGLQCRCLRCFSSCGTSMSCSGI